MTDPAGSPGRGRAVARVLLGLALAGAGVTHLTTAREEFRAQVPEFVPLDADTTVLVSGVVEIALGSALVLGRQRVGVGWVVAAFFVAVFPGNLAQWLHHRDGFGLDTDTKRFARLFFQPVLVAAALWSTGAWQAFRQRRRG
jgi:uncharacterized membrane protein